MIESFKKILNETKLENFVYIYFFGHDTRGSEGHLVFVLFENNGFDCSYLRGEVLRTCLDTMVKKGLLVIFVLDCCFSGGVARIVDQRVDQRVDVRAVPYSALIDAASSQEFDPGIFSSESISRSARMLSDEWLLNSEGYIILSACGPHEKAKEIEIQKEKRRGHAGDKKSRTPKLAYTPKSAQWLNR